MDENHQHIDDTKEYFLGCEEDLRALYENIGPVTEEEFLDYEK